MTLPVLIVRPMESALRTAEKVRKLGFAPVVDPLFEIQSMEWDPPASEEFDGLLLTSTNAVTFAGPAVQKFGDLPVLAVGERTADAAREAGLDVMETGNGGVQQLINRLPDDSFQRILRLTGKDQTAFDPGNREIIDRKVYRAKPLPLGADARAALAKGCLLLLFSARAGKMVEQEIQAANLSPGATRICALSANIADGLTADWQDIHVAAQPTEDALLSLLPALCLRD